MKRNDNGKVSDVVTAEEIISRYIELGRIVVETELSGDYKRGNRAGEAFIKYINIMKQDKELATKVLTEVMKCDEDCARSHAATLAWAWDIAAEEGIAILTEIEKRDDFIGHSSNMVMMQYRGEFPKTKDNNPPVWLRPKEDQEDQ